LFVNKHPRSLGSNHRERQFELLAAITTQRSEDVSGKALRVNTNQGRRGTDVARHQGHGFFRPAVKFAAKTKDTEIAPASRQLGRSNLLDCLWAHVDIIRVDS